MMADGSAVSDEVDQDMQNTCSLVPCVPSFVFVFMFLQDCSLFRRDY